MPGPSETEDLPELPVEGDEPKAAAQPEVPNFATEFGDTKMRSPTEWQQLCGRYCAGAQEYMKALMRELLTAKDEPGRATVMDKMAVIVDKLRQLRKDVAIELKETSTIQAEVAAAMESVTADFRKAAQTVTQEAEMPTLKKNSPALPNAKNLISDAIKSHGISSVLHPKWPNVASVMREKAQRKQAAAAAVPAHHTQELDNLGEALPTGDDTGQGQVLIYEGDPFPAATKPPKRAPTTKTAKPKAETGLQSAGRWAGNIASLGIAPAIRAGLRARARKKSQ